MTCPHTAALGGYLLGALEPDDRSIFESHMSGCDTCRTELVRLAPLPGLLHQITLEDFEDDEAPAPEPTVESTVEPTPAPQITIEEPVVLDATTTPSDVPTPRKRYWLVAAAAAAVLVLTVGGLLGYGVLQDSEEPPVGVTWSATDPTTGVRGDVRLIEHQEWGTEVQLRLSDTPPDVRCKLVVWDAYGEKEIAGWWGTGHQPYEEEIPGFTSFDLEHIDRFEVVTADDKMLVTIPASNGLQQPPS